MTAQNPHPATSTKDKPTLIIDVEIFANSFLLAGKYAGEDKKVFAWLHEPGGLEAVKRIMFGHYTFVTFNGRKFDIPVLSAAVAGRPLSEVKRIADTIIEQQMIPWQAEQAFGLKPLQVDHVDLREVAPSFVGLKTYGARMHMPWLKELPFSPHASLTDEQREQVLLYCFNDLETTEELFNRLKGPLSLRVAMSKQYGIDMRSKSDTQMAEAAFIKRLKLRREEPKVPQYVTYKAPAFISFDNPYLADLTQQAEGHKFIVNPATGHIKLPDFLDKEIRLNNGTYQMGVGGLHSTHDKKVCHVATDDYAVTDIDAASFYPSIIITCNLIPQNTGQKFIDEYKQIYVRRLEAKRSGDKITAETLKISLNGTFGKTASRWSPLYSPDLMIAITLTGQLTLLSLIEKLEQAGAETLSANTDGIAIGYPRKLQGKIEKVVSDFSTLSGFEFEYTPYRVLALKDVNNYIAVKPDRSVKAKGIYAPPDLRKNPTASICAKAVAQWLATGKKFEASIAEAKLTEFISARNVTGGGVQGKEYLGKVVRWYQTTDRSLPPLTYKKNGNKVPKTEGARACMLIDPNGPLPEDLDYEWYRKEAIRIAKDVGCEAYLTEEELQLVAPPPKIRKTRKTK